MCDDTIAGFGDVKTVLQGTCTLPESVRAIVRKSELQLYLNESFTNLLLKK